MTQYTEVIYTPKQLEKALAYWQQRLRLGDWLVTARLARTSEFTNDTADAEVLSLRSSKVAEIKILDKRDFETSFNMPQDMEWSLVHELLHLHISGVKAENGDEFEWSLYEEQVIDSIAHALVVTRREAAK